MKNSYQQLEKVALPLIKSYKEDLTKHDKTHLKDYSGKFLSIVRDTGTYLLKLPETPYEVREHFKYSFLIGALSKGVSEKDFEQFTILNYYTRTDDYNVTIFYFDRFNVRKVTPDQAKHVLYVWFDNLPAAIEGITFVDPKDEILRDFRRYLRPKYTQIWEGNTSTEAKYINFTPVELSSRTKVDVSTLGQPFRGNQFAGGKIRYWLDVPRKKVYYQFTK